MTTSTRWRPWALPGIVLLALIASAPTRAAPPDMFAAADASGAPHEGGVAVPSALRQAPPKFVVAPSFYATHLAPRMSADARVGDVFIEAHLGDPASNLWRRDAASVNQVESRTIRSFTDAFKGYAIEQLGIDRWSIPVMGRHGGAPLADDSRRVRFHLGFSRLAPRADLLIPVTSGRVALSADARGRLRTTFEPSSSRFRLAADVDVPARTATMSLSARF